MSDFTISLRTLIQTDFVPALNEYPIFDEAYRPVLNKKIIDFYLFHEIGQETPDMFNHYLKNKMDLIMPYYNEMYKTQSLIANPLHNFDLSETNSKTSSSTTTGTNTETTEQDTGTTFNKGKVQSHSAQSDTPQSNLTPYNVASGGYASLVNMSETESMADSSTGNVSSDSTMDMTSQNNAMEQYVRNVSGTQGVNIPETLEKYKEAYINIDLEIIKELRELFMLVY